MRQIFLGGFLLGIVIMNVAKGILLEETDLLDEYSLYSLKYMTVNSRVLFVYVLGKRLPLWVFVIVLSTTYLGLAVVCAVSAWYGFLTGAFLSAAVLRYGFKGLLLALTGIFPHYLVYVPMGMMLLVWCEHVCRNIYFKGTRWERGGRREVFGQALRLLMILGALLLGCLLESYVNPVILGGFLKIF